MKWAWISAQPAVGAARSASCFGGSRRRRHHQGRHSALPVRHHGDQRTVLKDTVLMLIADQNKKGGLLGRKLEPVVVDPASDWDAFTEKARELLAKEKVAVVFGCWTSALPKGGHSRVRAIERPAFLSRSIRRRRKLAQCLLHRRCAKPAGDSGRSLPDEQGGRRDSPLGPARDRKRLSAQDQPDFERISRGGRRASRGHHDDLHTARAIRTGARSSRGSRPLARRERRPP